MLGSMEEQLCISWISALQGGIHEGSGKIPLYVPDHNWCAHHSIIHSPRHSSIRQLWGALSPLNFQCFLILLRARASSLYDLATGQFSPSNVSPRDQSRVIRLDSSLISIPWVIPSAPLICFHHCSCPLLPGCPWLTSPHLTFIWSMKMGPIFGFAVGSGSFPDLEHCSR